MSKPARRSAPRTSAARRPSAARSPAARKPAGQDSVAFVAAIQRSLVVIEFALDGTILDANENFLKSIGYSLAEIKGKPHAMLLHPARRDSAEYRGFWEKFRRGEFDCAHHKYRAKDGSDVWMRSTYSPLLDVKGRPFKVVNCAVDITQSKLRTLDSEGQLAGVNRSRAAVHFDMDGKVQRANENFLKLTGYTLDEVRGKPHDFFLDAAERETAEAREFWEKLRRGEHQSGQYRRVGKDGKLLWLQANYNPILDSDGKPFKVTVFATDITAEKLHSADFEGQLKAVNKAQAVIEFKLDGTVITANDNFLATIGYSLEEIRGKHHGMFVDEAMRGSPEYRAFWEKLNRGEYEAGQYKRIGKGGKELWLQASYNPILDMNGRPFKVVKYATDITAQRHEAEMNAAFKGALENLTSNVMVADNDLNIIYTNKTMRDMMANAQTDLRKDLPSFDATRLNGANIDIFHKNPAHQRGMLASLTKTHVGQFVVGGRTLRIIANPMLDAGGRRLGTVVEWADRTAELAVEREVESMVTAVAEGNFEMRIPLDGKSGFFEMLCNGINRMTDNMTQIVGWVQASAKEVSRGAEEISQGNTDLSQRTEEQASSLEETASSMEQMTSTVKQNADNSTKASQLATAARDQADKGGTVVNQAMRAMTEINESSRKIVDIIGVIDEIAFQTNLLALNAAVEAARAGEQGRGFAVVASEVRNLAGRSATAAKEIKRLIQDSVKKVDEGSSLVTQSGETLEQIVAAVKKVSDIIGEIAAASHEQSSGIEQVNKAVMQLDEMTQQNAGLVEQASAASQSVAGQATALSAMRARYKLTRAGAEAAYAAMTASQDGQGKRPKATAAAPVAAAAPPAERRTPTRPWHKPAAAPPPAARPASNGHAAATGTDGDWSEF